MKILTLCLLAASAFPTPNGLATEAAQTIKDCGAPTRDFEIPLAPVAGYHPKARVLAYPKVTLYFTDNAIGGSRYMYAKTKPGGATVPDEQLNARMPCLANAGLGAPL